MINKSPPIRPQIPSEEVLMVGGEEDGEEKGLDELFADGNEEKIPDEIDGGNGTDDVEDFSRQDCEGASAHVLPDPGEPTASQIEDHRALGHVPYRSWCDECRKGRSTGKQHRHRKGERNISVFSFDYLYLDKSGRQVAHGQAHADMDEVDVTILW